MPAPTDADFAAVTRRLAARLEDTGRRLATAESCTGGWVAKACTDLPGSSNWFVGGAVAYADDAKIRLLGVSRETLRRHGAVSEHTVREMATGALDRFDSDLSVAISGIAGPDGGTVDKPVGTVWFAWARRSTAGVVELQSAREVLPGDRDAVRRRAVQHALERLLEL